MEVSPGSVVGGTVGAVVLEPTVDEEEEEPGTVVDDPGSTEEVVLDAEVVGVPIEEEVVGTMSGAPLSSATPPDAAATTHQAARVTRIVASTQPST